jgi:hypothetical protein
MALLVPYVEWHENVPQMVHQTFCCCTEQSEDLESWSYDSESFDRTVSPCLLFRGLRIVNRFSRFFVADSSRLGYVDVHAGLEAGNPDQNAPVFGHAISDGARHSLVNSYCLFRTPGGYRAPIVGSLYGAAEDFRDVVLRRMSSLIGRWAIITLKHAEG